MKLTKIEKTGLFKFIHVYYLDEDGLKQGKYRSYRPNGSKFLECNYRDGVLHGKYIEYRKNGMKMEEGLYKNGIILKKTIYNENGQKVEERKYFYPEEDKE